MADEALAQEIAELLERATDLEAKAAVVDALPVTTTADGGVDELRARVDELEELVFALQNSTPIDEDPAALAALVGGPAAGGDFDGMDADLPVDFTVDDDELDEGSPVEEAAESPVEEAAEDEGKGWMPCPKCGAGEADEYKDGTARCSECGTPLHELAAKSGDVSDLEAKAMAGESDEMVALSEIELLMSRRAGL